MILGLRCNIFLGKRLGFVVKVPGSVQWQALVTLSPIEMDLLEGAACISFLDQGGMHFDLALGIS